MVNHFAHGKLVQSKLCVVHNFLIQIDGCGKMVPREFEPQKK